MSDLSSTINGGAIAMPNPEQMDRRLILKRAHQNSSGSSGSEPESKNLRKRLNVGESGDSIRSSTFDFIYSLSNVPVLDAAAVVCVVTSGTTTENDALHKVRYLPPQCM